MEKNELLEQAKEVLIHNGRGSYTIPAEGLYPHQWFWDSCFIAIGLRHTDIEHAKTEIRSLLRGQWANGMVPHMLLSSTHRRVRDGHIWNSWLNLNSPDDVPTSGITQPPMLAEAIVKIGEKLPMAERRLWYRQLYPNLLKYHEWIYADRDPHGEGLALQIHPWETGLDNTPPWASQLHEHLMPMWVRLVEKSRIDWFINLVRRDTKFVHASQRLSTADALAYYSIQRRLRRKRYETDKILNHTLFAIEDLTFNCILIRANNHLQEIAKTIGKQLPTELLECMAKTEAALGELWDPYTSQYYSRNFITHKLIKEPTIATLMPLYAGCISKERAEQLIKMLEDENQFGLTYPVPSVPIHSAWFNPVGYWQGPTWVNTNWLIIDGMKRLGFTEQAKKLTELTLEMIRRSGFHEYFNPLTGEGVGANNFSWTAALAIDLASGKEN